MLMRTAHVNGVVTYQSSLLRAVGVVHGFSTRIGGVSEGPFAALNLGNPSASEGAARDTQEHMTENFRRLQETLGLGGHLRAWVTQVHGRTVELIEGEPEGEDGETLAVEVRDRFSGQLAADGLVAAVPGVMLTIRVADCVPVLLATEDGRAVAAVHAGWRGVVGNVVERAVRVIHEAAGEAGRAEKLVAAIGPGICAKCFEVGAEVATEFRRRDLGAAVMEPSAKEAGAKPHVDLAGAIALQLRRAGVAHVDSGGLCTFENEADFFSHRRDHGVTGRMAAVIAAR